MTSCIWIDHYCCCSYDSGDAVSVLVFDSVSFYLWAVSKTYRYFWREFLLCCVVWIVISSFKFIALVS
jgi:hypothetical protein